MERIQAVHTLRRSARYVGGGGFEARYQEENKRPNRVRQEFYFQGMTGVNAWDGTTGWKIEPWGGKKDVEPLSEEETKTIIVDADFDGPLVNYKEKGNKVEYLGTEPVEGTDAHKLRVTIAATGEVRIYYMDTDYNVPIRVDTKRMVRGAEREYERNKTLFEQSVITESEFNPLRKGETVELGFKVERLMAGDVTFAEDGTVSVSPGCNRGSGSYERGEGTVSVGPLVLTRMACQGPRGEREQRGARPLRPR
mgnify:CR=1 FL=1